MAAFKWYCGLVMAWLVDAAEDEPHVQLLKQVVETATTKVQNELTSSAIQVRYETLEREEL